MVTVSALAKWEGLSFILALMALLATKLLVGEINTSGLFHGRLTGRRLGEDRYFSPERVQLFVFTVGAALYYLTLALNDPTAGKLPDVPQAWPVLLGGSNAIYLGGKA